MEKIRFINNKGREVFLNPKLASNPAYLKKMNLHRDQIQAPKNSTDAKPPKKEEEKKEATVITDYDKAKVKYKEVLGKRPHHSWDVETLNQKINAELNK